MPDMSRAETNSATDAEIDEAHEWNKIIESVARKDSLTGLPNRRALDSYLEQQVGIAKRYNRPLTVIMLDLNGFKNINDTAGHVFGDLVLKAVADNLRGRGTDFLARYGGDEFVLVLPETPPDKTNKVVNRVLEGLNQYGGRYKQETLRVGGSMGVAVFGEKMAPSDLLIEADGLLYQAKKAGKKIPRQEHLLGSVARKNDQGQIVIEHYERGEVGAMFEAPTIIASS